MRSACAGSTVEDANGLACLCRHSDFIVSEVGLDGRVAAISDLVCEAPLCLHSEPRLLAEGPSTKTDGGVTVEQLRASPLGRLFATTSEEASEVFFKSLAALSAGPLDGVLEDRLTSPPLPSKEDRTTFHHTVRELFKGSLQTEGRDAAIVVYRRMKESGRKVGSKRGLDDRNFETPNQHRFIAFVLRKENMDTIEAIQVIAKRLHMAPRDFSYGGTKDRRAITFQVVVARNTTPNKIAGINKAFPDGRLAVSNIRLAEAPLNLGDHRGNRFGLIIRDLAGAAKEAICDCIDAFKAEGFVNYFGMQRFGMTDVPSHHIGMALLSENWSGAIDLILMPRASESDSEARAARMVWKESRDARRTLSAFPMRYTAERQILAHLLGERNGAALPAAQAANDHLGAIMAINRELRLMYLHSVQSYIWNRVATRRHQTWGRIVKVGDLVLGSASTCPEGALDGGPEQRSRATASPLVVTEETLKEYSGDDVLLPIPGYNTLYPQNASASWYRDEFALLPCFKVPGDQQPGGGAADEAAWTDKVRDIFGAPSSPSHSRWDLPGAYRRIYAKPTDLTYVIGSYSNGDELLTGEALRTAPSQETGSRPHLGLFISFTLPSSSYATMALREVMHRSMDPRGHKALTKANQETLAPQAQHPIG